MTISSMISRFCDLFRKKVVAHHRIRKQVVLELKVTRADGTVELYRVDRKGQRRIA